MGEAFGGLDQPMSNLKIYDDRNKLWLALADYSQSLAKISTEEAPVAYEVALDLVKLADEVKEKLRERLIDHTQINGQQVGDKGTLEAVMGDKVVRCIPTRTGLDPKQIEGLMRSKGLDPNTNMRSTVTYAVDYEKISDLINMGKLTNSEVEKCRYDKAHRIQVLSPNAK